MIPLALKGAGFWNVRFWHKASNSNNSLTANGRVNPALGDVGAHHILAGKQRLKPAAVWRRLELHGSA